MVIGWVFFRLDTFDNALTFLQRLFVFDTHLATILFTPELIFYFALAAFFSFMGLSSFGKNLSARFYKEVYSTKEASVWAFITLILLILNISFLASKGFNPFIYFRF